MKQPKPVNIRRAAISAGKRIVIKVGSRLLSDVNRDSQQNRIHELIAEISGVRDRGHQPILVSSGAISSGLELMGIRKRPRDLPQLQSLAAIGQSRLMSLYEKACIGFGFHCAQILLSYDDLKSRKRHLNLCNCIYSLLSHQVLPIINENDVVSTDEIRFGDNDKLAALVAAMTRSDLTILLTSVDGLIVNDNNDQRENRISVINNISEEIRRVAKGTDGNPLSTGGMASKLVAAEICMAAGESLWIANGTDFGILRRIMDGQDVGTLFYSKTDKMPNSKRWLAFFSDPSGELVIDAGAVHALVKAGKSLLPSGVLEYAGVFDQGDTVHIMDVGQKVLGMGITNYCSDDIERIKGLQSTEVFELFNEQTYTEVIHRDNMVIMPVTGQ